MERTLDVVASDLIDRCFSEAVEGRHIWLDIKSRLSWEEDWSLIIVPDDKSILVEALVRNFSEIYRKKYMKKAIIISAHKIEGVLIGAMQVQIDMEDIVCLLRYYRLCQFASNIYVVSSDSPYGNDGIIGIKGITVDDYLIDSVFSERG